MVITKYGNQMDRRWEREEQLQVHHAQATTKNSANLLVWVEVSDITIGVVWYAVAGFSFSPGKFAQCISDSHRKFYGSVQCAHYTDHENVFSESMNYISYDDYDQLSSPQGPACQIEDIQSCSTWIFADGLRLAGRLAFEGLAEKTGCAI